MATKSTTSQRSNKSQRPKKALGLTPNQQWLALALVAILGILAVFFFNFGTTPNQGTGHSGYLVPFPVLLPLLSRLRR